MTNSPVDRRTLLRRGAAVGAAGVLASIMVPGTAQANDNDSEKNDDRRQRPTLAGAWLEKVTISGLPPIQVLNTFDGAGGLTACASTDAMPGFRASPVHGAWTRTGPRTFRWQGIGFAFDDQGALVATDRIQKDVTVAPNGNTYAGTGTFSRVGLNGAVLFTVGETVAATRITA